MATVRMLCGPQRSERARAAHELIADHWGHAVLLVPTRALARQRTESLLLDHDLPGAWGRPVLTFQDFATDVLRQGGPQTPGRDLSPIPDFQRRLLLASALHRLAGHQALAPFQDVVDTPGFVAQMLRTITQLKQAAIEPDDFRKRVENRSGATAMDEVVALAYEAYQQALIDADAYDLVGLYWEAAVLCETDTPAALQRLDVLVLDAFDDFTPSEFRLLNALEPHVTELAFGISLNRDVPSQSDLYALPAATSQGIAKAFPGVSVTDYPEEPPASLSQFLASGLFWRDQPPLPPRFEPNVELAPCAGHVHEVETIGRRIKSLLTDGEVRADEIAVVYRDTSDAAGTVRSVFDEFGIPVRIVSAGCLIDSAVAGLLLGLLESIDEWPRDGVVDVIASPWFRPPEGPTAAQQSAFGALSRLARVVAGEQDWFQRVQHVVERLGKSESEETDAIADRIPDAHACSVALIDALIRFREIAALFPTTGKADAFLAAVSKTLQALGVSRALEDDARIAASIRADEARAVDALYALLGVAAPAFSALRAGEELNRREFAALLRQALRDTQWPEPPQTGPAVQCIPAERIRQLRFDYVFFAGVNEGVVPRPPATSAVYGDQDIDEFERLGIPVDDKRKHAERERLLFHHVASAARERLHISWSTLALDGGRPASPSPFVEDVRGLLGDAVIAHPAPHSASFVPSAEALACPRDLLNLAMAERWRPEDVPEGYGLRDVAGRAAIESGRFNPHPFDAYDGVLSSSDLIESLAKEYGPDHQFSASQLEEYRGCPFRFFVTRVLRIDDIETPVEEFDARVRGLILHEILETFHRRHVAVPVSLIDPAEASSAMSEIVDDVFARRGRQSITAPEGLVRVEQERMKSVLDRYLRNERDEGESDWKPTHFELSFGEVRGGPSDPPSTGQPFGFETPDGAVLINGRIDRVDVFEDSLRILDYKTTVATKPKDIKAGVSLQLGLYASAVEGLLFKDASCDAAWFVAVGKPRNEWREGLGKSKPAEYSQRQSALREAVAQAVAGIRSGAFPPTPYDKSCTYCPYTGTCRHEPGRIRRKQAASDASGEDGQ